VGSNGTIAEVFEDLIRMASSRASS